MAVPVRPDGKVAAPLVEEIVAQGKTSSELARDVEKQLSKYVRDPVVTVLVTASTYPSIPDLYTHCKARQVKASTALTTRRQPLLAQVPADTWTGWRNRR